MTQGQMYKRFTIMIMVCKSNDNYCSMAKHFTLLVNTDGKVTQQ